MITITQMFNTEITNEITIFVFSFRTLGLFFKNHIFNRPFEI